MQGENRARQQMSQLAKNSDKFDRQWPQVRDDRKLWKTEAAEVGGQKLSQLAGKHWEMLMKKGGCSSESLTPGTFP